MGIQDRDYYWERHANPAPRARRNQRSTTRQALVWIAAMLLTTLAVKVALISRHLQPFPPAGTVHWYIDPPHGTSTTARLTLKAPANQRLTHFAVLLHHWDTHQPVALIPMPTGAIVTVPMPLGRYRLTVVKGMLWQGPEKLFAYETYANESLQPVALFREGPRIVGSEIELERMVGNMEMKALRGAR